MLESNANRPTRCRFGLTGLAEEIVAWIGRLADDHGRNGPARI
jgi:hypothetical protein